jgi:hypothetical protein
MTRYEGQPVMLELTSSQVGSVVAQSAGSSTTLAALLTAVAESGAEAAKLLAAVDVDYSRSTLRAVLLLSVLPADGSFMDLAQVASRLDTNKSTTHRYLKTWIALGLVEQDADTRRYRRSFRALGAGDR